jgi:hypothetical protein
MDMNSIASMVEGGAGLAEGIYGWLKGKEGKKEMDALMANYPKWEIPNSYKESMNIMGQLANGNMPGYDLAKEGIQETMAQTAGEAKEGAISSSQYQDTMARMNQRSLKAIRDLNIQNAQMKAAAQKDFAGAKSAYGDLETQQWDQNINRLWNIKMNMAQSKYNEGTAMVQSGVDTFVQSGFDFAGSGGSTSGTSGLLQKSEG